MGMSTHVVGFRPADSQWESMKRIWEECERAGVEIPEAVLDFFEHEAPGDKPGQEIDISGAVTKYSGVAEDGYAVDVSKLPPSCSVVLFYNGY